MSTREEFESYGYRVLRGLINGVALDRLHLYARRRAKSGLGDYSDIQVPGTPSFYGDPVMDQLLEEIRPLVEEAAGRELYPTYSYFRVYKTGDALSRHTDRPACEISVSVCLGIRGATDWPLFVEGPQGIHEARLLPGDGLLYKGMECPHWREPFEGESGAQVFLHYVDKNGDQREWRFDKRDGLSGEHTSQLLGG